MFAVAPTAYVAAADAAAAAAAAGGAGAAIALMPGTCDRAAWPLLVCSTSGVAAEMFSQISQLCFAALSYCVTGESSTYVSQLCFAAFMYGVTAEIYNYVSQIPLRVLG